MDEVPGAGAALIAGGLLTTAGSVFAVIGLLRFDKKQKEGKGLSPTEERTAEALAITFLGLGAVLLLWRDAYEAGEGLYWLVLALFGLAGAGYVVRSHGIPAVREVIAEWKQDRRQKNKEKRKDRH